MAFVFDGDNGGRWCFNLTAAAATSRRSTPFIGWEASDPERRVWIQRVIAHDLTVDDRAHLLRAFDVSQLPLISACPTILRVLDKAEPHDFFFVSELAQESLDDALRRGRLPPGKVEAIGENVSAALRVIHEAGRIHGDVQPSNVLIVDGVWKLADLGASVALGQPIDCMPRDKRFVPADLIFGAPAQAETDWYGLERILALADGTE